MRRAHVNLWFEGGPPLLKFTGCPLVPTLVNQITPSNIVFRVKVQGRDSKMQLEQLRYDRTDTYLWMRIFELASRQRILPMLCAVGDRESHLEYINESYTDEQRGLTICSCIGLVSESCPTVPKPPSKTWGCWWASYQARADPASLDWCTPLCWVTMHLVSH